MTWPRVRRYSRPSRFVPTFSGSSRRARADRLSDEIAAAHWIPVADLLRTDIHGEVEVEVQSRRLRTPAFRLEEGTVWGMTERILSDILR